MKSKKITGITLMLASAVVSSALGGALLGKNAVSADSTTYALSDIFTVSKAEIVTVAESTEEEAKNITAFKLSDAGTATIKRSLALKWYEGKEQEKGFSVTFSFNDLDFNTVTFSMDTTSAWATKNELSTNALRFRKTDKGVIAYVINGEIVEYDESADDTKLSTAQKEFKAKEAELIANATEVFFEAKKEYTFSLTEGETDGEFAADMLIDSARVSLGSFTNIGANYAKYTYNESYPLTISADLGEDSEDDATTTVCLHDINGQSFDNVTVDGTSLTVTDDAKPVLVVNEDVDGFILGTQFSLDYTVLDVLQSKNLDSDLEYYQYNPTKELNDDNYATLSTSTIFKETVYKLEGSDSYTSVYREEEKTNDGVGREFVSIRMSLADDTFTGTDKAVYDLSWYANASAVASPDGENDYIILDRNEEGARYKHIVLDESDPDKAVNQKDSTLDTLVAEFMEVDEETGEAIGELAKAAEDVYVGSSIYFPSFEWFIGDNNGYRNLKFTICYKTKNTTSSSSSLSYNALKLSISEAGEYEFKIFATDKKGNAMRYANEDGKVVEISTSNIWDIEEIPSFKFTIKDLGLKVEDPTSSSGRKDTELLDKTYTFDDLDVVGAHNLKEKYALYKVELDEYNTANPSAMISIDDLTAISYSEIAEVVSERLSEVTNKNYFELYLDIYAKKIASRIGVSDDKVAAIKACFKAVGEVGDTVNNLDDTWDEYNWSASSKSFETVAVGQYLMLADYWEEEMPTTRRAAGYMLLDVSSKGTTIEGDTEWLKNNLVSVILFSIAGVMLILIIILLLIKPSDETLEDVDAATKVAKKEKKAKKEKEDK